MQTGQRGCAPRVDSNFLLPIPLCYVRNPGTCISAFPVCGCLGGGLRACCPSASSVVGCRSACIRASPVGASPGEWEQCGG